MSYRDQLVAFVKAQSSPVREPTIAMSNEVRRGDVITGRRRMPEWRPTWRALVLSASWFPTHLSLDLMWLDDWKIETGCSAPRDEEFMIERGDVDLLIDHARKTFAGYAERHGL